MALLGRILLIGAALAVVSDVLDAQAPAKAPSCDIGDVMKGNTARAALAFDVARQATGTPLAATNLKSAIKQVESPEKSGDEPVARAYILGEALSLWLNQPGTGATAKRRDLGFTTNPDATIDIVGALDSAFRIVEAAKPNCLENTSFYRGGHKYYLDVANGAINSLNADKLDSAEYYATQANRLYPASPYGTMVLGSVASKLKEAVKLVETPEKSGDDPVARAFVLGEALSLWLNQPGIGATAKRGDLGFTTNPDATIDLVGTLDSAFKIVEAAKPNCSDNTAYYRGGHKYYLDVANGAINSLNADKLDSAVYYATQANRLFPASPYGTMVLGSVAAKRNDNTTAVRYWMQAAEAAERDTSYRDVRRQMLANSGSVYLNTAQSATGAERNAAARKAAETYALLIAVPGTKGSYMYGGRQNYQTALLLVGDTAAFVKSYEALLANPSAYEYQDLLNSAVNAARSNRQADAARLFEGTLALNPWNRDALFNLAVTYLALEQNVKVSPITTRLVAVDPGNPENYNLGARAYLSLAKVAQTAKKTAVAAAYNDSTLTWYTKGNKLPVEVTFTEFSPTESQVIIGGSVLDRRDKIDADAATTRPVRGKAPAKPAASSLPARAVTLRFEALDKAGAVIGSETVTTEALTPGKSVKFTVKMSAPNVMAYRYTIVG